MTTPTDSLAGQAEFFSRHGYLLAPGVLTPGEVEELRYVCGEVYHATGQAEAFTSHFLTEQRLASIPFREGIIELLSHIVGPGYTVYPNFTMRTKLYVPWHVDNGFIRADHTVSRADFVQCAIYLQENSEVYGGGLDVVPGSHRLPATTDRDELIKRTRDETIVASGPGDLVLWDSRLLHRSTPPLLTTFQTKFGIHWTVSRRDAQAKPYLKHLASRARRELNGRPVTVPRFEDMQAIRFPDDYPPSVIESVRAHGLHVASHAEL